MQHPGINLSGVAYKITLIANAVVSKLCESNLSGNRHCYRRGGSWPLFPGRSNLTLSTARQSYDVFVLPRS